MQTITTEQDTQRDILESQTSVPEKENKQNSSEELIEQEEVEGTPFKLVNIRKGGWFIALGRHRLTEMQENKQELIEKIVNKDWTLVLDTIVALTLAVGHDDMTK